MRNRILQGDVLAVAKGLPDQSVNCIVTSPPYFNQREYNLPVTMWPEVTYAPLHGLPHVTIPAMSCSLGRENTIEAYVGNMVSVFRVLRPKLRDDGVVWLNLGDKMANDSKTGGSCGNKNGHSINGGYQAIRENQPKTGLPPKNLCGIPWRVTLALQADGWFLRSDVIWEKKNCMPSSVKDRPTTSHEYIFLLTKSAQYFYDQDAIREPLAEASWGRKERKENLIERTGAGTLGKQVETGVDQSAGLAMGRNGKSGYDPAGRQKRTVWTVATVSLKAVHFAAFPPKLIEPCILAGCPVQVCAECGEPWVRVIERTGESLPVEERTGRTGHNGQPPQISGNYWDGPTTKPSATFTPTCACNGHFEDQDQTGLDDFLGKLDPINVYIPHIPLAKHPTRPGVVLDPFLGSGTTAQVAIQNRRDWLGIELNPEYIELAKDRIDGLQVRLL